MTPPPDFVPFDEDAETSDADRRRGEENRRRVFADAIRHAVSGRALSAEAVAAWHRNVLEGLSYVLHPCYLGGYRGSAHPWLVEYLVQVGGAYGAHPARVREEVRRFFEELATRTQEAARRVPLDRDRTPSEIRRVVELAAWSHGEWVRIHPFANGNGRIARLLANFVLARFRVPPLLRLRPRPEAPYARAALASMIGDHSLTEAWILRRLQDAAS
ncbi:MAG: Fic family protein [Planctomycetes bacterium]|nr:Fic family protein [Planctomycetota bacterium]